MIALGNGRTYAGMGVDFADYNNDGLPDLVVTALANQMYALYRNNGDGSFSYDTYTSGLGRMTLLHSGWGAKLAESPLDEQRATLGVQTLQAWYDLDTGLYKTTGWWNSANAITVLADYVRVTQTRDYDFVFSNTLSIAQKPRLDSLTSITTTKAGGPSHGSASTKSLMIRAT